MAVALATRRPWRQTARNRTAISLAIVGAITAAVMTAGPAWASSPPSSRRASLAAATLGIVGGTGASFPAKAAKDNGPVPIPPGYVPAGFMPDGKKQVGQKIVTPNGLEYEMLEAGTDKEGRRHGPPHSGSKAWVRFTGHVDDWNGPVFDSSAVRGARNVGHDDYVEIVLNGETTITNGLFEALKVMKVGEKGRFMQPPLLSYKLGEVSFEGDSDLNVKVDVPAGAPLYYDVELVNIIKP